MKFVLLDYFYSYKYNTEIDYYKNCAASVSNGEELIFCKAIIKLYFFPSMFYTAAIDQQSMFIHCYNHE